MGAWRKAPEPVARVFCDQCAAVTVPFSELTIRVIVGLKEHYGDYEKALDSEYRYRCTDCERIIVNKIHPSMLRNLLSQPLEREWCHLPEELDEPHHLPPITYDDFLDFKRELETL